MSKVISRCKETPRRLVESHALRALNKRQTSVKKFKKVNSKMPSLANGGTRIGPQKVKFMQYMQVKCLTDTKRTKVKEVLKKVGEIT